MARFQIHGAPSGFHLYARQLTQQFAALLEADRRKRWIDQTRASGQKPATRDAVAHGPAAHRDLDDLKVDPIGRAQGKGQTRPTDISTVEGGAARIRRLA